MLNFSLLLWLAVVVGLAWAVGAYSRLSRMREQALRARASLLKYGKLYQVLAHPWQAGAGVAFDGSVRTWTDMGSAGMAPLKNLFVAVQALQESLAAWECSSPSQVRNKTIGGALDAVQSCVDVLASAPEDLAGALWPVDERSRWLDLAADIRVRRSRYNAYASELNEAVSQMPAAVIARLLGLQEWELV